MIAIPRYLLLVLVLLAAAQPTLAEKPTVLIVYYSQTGNTEKMAKAVMEGVQRVDGVTVLLRTVKEVTREELKACSGLILGTPTSYANMAAPMQQFIDDWFNVYKLALTDKVGAAFATGGGMTGGKEHAVISLLLAMLNNGMMVVGPVYDGYGTFGVSAITDEPDPGLSEYELKDARRLGERVAQTVLRIDRP